MRVKCRQDVLIGDMDNYTHLNLDVKCLCCDICCKSSQCGARKSNLNMFASFSRGIFHIHLYILCIFIY